MKKTILALALLLIGTGSAIAQKKAAPAKKPAAAAAAPKAGANMFNCTIDGKPYTATGGKVYVTAKLKTYKDPPYLSVMLFSEPKGLHYALEFELPPNGELAPGEYPIGTGETLESKFPAVYFDVTDERTSDIKLFSHTLEGSGTVTVTSVTNGIVEGTFAFKLTGGSDGNMEVSNGSFKFKMPPVEKK